MALPEMVPFVKIEERENPFQDGAKMTAADKPEAIADAKDQPKDETNYSLITVKGAINIAPGFDLVPGRPYNVTQDVVKKVTDAKMLLTKQ